MASRVLLITPQFYGTEEIIKSALEALGYKVTWVENKTLAFDYYGTKAKFKILRRIYFFLFSPEKKYLKKEFKRIGNLRFDILFSINAHVICPFLINKLKMTNPSIISVLYLWDSFTMYNWANKLKFFDKAFTFDRVDSLGFKIGYKPNFYIKQSDPVPGELEYDLFFAGKFSSARLSFIEKILKQPDISELKFFLKLWPAYRILFHSHFLYRLFKTLKIRDTSIRNYVLNYEAVEGILKNENIINESINYTVMQSYMMHANVILDIPYDEQRGYTHRVIDALANGKKLLTTNPDIKKESFYNPEQIHITDKQNPEFDWSWVRDKTTFVVSDYFSDLELSNWLKPIIND